LWSVVDLARLSPVRSGRDDIANVTYSFGGNTMWKSVDVTE